MEIIVDQLPSLVNALSEKDVYVLRRVLRSLSHVTSKSEAAAEAMRCFPPSDACFAMSKNVCMYVCTARFQS